MKRPSLVVGLGLNSKATSEEIIRLVSDVLGEAHRRCSDVAVIATAEHRRGHPALEDLPVAVTFFDSNDFADGAVCERAAALAAPDGVVLIPKRCSANACVCVCVVTDPSSGEPLST